MIRVFFLLASFFLFSAPTYAVNYYWTRPGSANQYATATLACNSLRSPIYNCTVSSCSQDTSNEMVVTYVSDIKFMCKETARPSGTVYNTFYVNRAGDSCSGGKVYDSSTGSCSCPAGTTLTNGQCVQDNPCLSKSGGNSHFSKSGNVGDSFFSRSGTRYVYPDTGCQAGCAGTLSSVKCKLVAGEPGSYSCAGTLYFSGSTCSSGSGGDVGESTTPNPPPAEPTEDSTNNCGSWISSGAGQSQTCVSTTTRDKPGISDSGNSPSPTPTSSKDETTTVTDKTPTPDGGSNTTTTTNSTNTYCTVGSCTTTSTSTSQSNTQDSSGNTTGSTSTCSGSNCIKPTDGTGTTSGSGTGGDGTSVTGGYGGQLAGKQQGNFDSANSYWEQKISDSKQELRDKLAQIKSTLTATTTPNLSSGSGGLPCESVSFGHGYEFDLCMTPFEGTLAGFKTFILFLAAIIAFYIVFVRS